MLVYVLWLFLVIFLVLIIYLTLKLSFEVPLDKENSPISWIRQNRRPQFIFLIILLVLSFLFSFVMFFIPQNVEFETPLTHPGIFLLSTTILLLSNFFIVKTSTDAIIDVHPLIFYVAVYFIIMVILAGIFTSIKKFRLNDISY